MWKFQEVRSGVGGFHGMEHHGGREVWLHCWGDDEERGALVLGSSQSEELVNAEVLRRRGLELVKRQSGGGAVLVVPEALVWIDVFIPRDDPLWEDDVSKSALWLGEVWQATLAEFGVTTEVHQCPYQPSKWGELVCFAGRGAGEVFVGDKKSVGISQRRTRQGARFQTALARQWNITDLSPLLNLSPEDRFRLETETATAAHPLPLPPKFVFTTFCQAIKNC